ncbi:MAG: hypothetical protein RLZZ31_1439 [Actinomycetota bacterium]
MSQFDLALNLLIAIPTNSFGTKIKTKSKFDETPSVRDLS